MLLSFLLVINGIYGAAEVYNCENCRRTPIYIQFTDTCDESCAENVLESANATYDSTLYDDDHNSIVLQTVPGNDSWDIIVDSDEVMGVKCHVCSLLGVYQPVCGSDNVTYNSAEVLECEAQCPENGTEPVTIVRQGVCEAAYVCNNCPTRKTPIWVWFDQWCDEACATQIMENVNAVDYTIEDGVTSDDWPYITNQTYMAVLNTDLADEDMNQLLDTLHVVRVACQDVCPRITWGIDSIDDNPLCGSDGQDYANQNQLDCAVGNWCPGEEPVTIAKHGACNSTDDDKDASSSAAASTSLVLRIAIAFFSLGVLGFAFYMCHICIHRKHVDTHVGSEEPIPSV